MDEREFRGLCERHDLTYAFSDDHRLWRAGVVTHDEVKAAAAMLPRDVAVRVWNEVVDQKILPGSREMFYWK
jgi:hypothetical protein